MRHRIVPYATRKRKEKPTTEAKHVIQRLKYRNFTSHARQKIKNCTIDGRTRYRKRIGFQQQILFYVKNISCQPILKKSGLMKTNQEKKVRMLHWVERFWNQLLFHHSGHIAQTCYRKHHHRGVPHVIPPGPPAIPNIKHKWQLTLLINWMI